MTNTDSEQRTEFVRELIRRTELRDVRLVSIDATNDASHWPADGNVEVTPDNVQFRLDDRQLQVRFKHTVTYQTAETTELAHIAVEHLATYSWEDTPGDSAPPTEPDTINEWIERVVYFTVYPYVRSALQTTALAMSIPPVVLGYLRQDLVPSHVSLIASPTSESNGE